MYIHMVNILYTSDYTKEIRLFIFILQVDLLIFILQVCGFLYQSRNGRPRGSSYRREEGKSLLAHELIWLYLSPTFSVWLSLFLLFLSLCLSVCFCYIFFFF